MYPFSPFSLLSAWFSYPITKVVPPDCAAESTELILCCILVQKWHKSSLLWLLVVKKSPIHKSKHHSGVVESDVASKFIQVPCLNLSRLVRAAVAYSMYMVAHMGEFDRTRAKRPRCVSAGREATQVVCNKHGLVATGDWANTICGHFNTF